MKKISFYPQLTPKNNLTINKTLEMSFNIPREFIVESSIYVDKNEFKKIKNMNKEPNQNLKALLKNI